MYTIHGILQATILEWVAFPFSRGSSQPGDRTQVSHIAAAAKSLQSCPTLCDSIDGSPPGSPVPGILQARTLEWVAPGSVSNGGAIALLWEDLRFVPNIGSKFKMLPATFRVTW